MPKYQCVNAKCKDFNQVKESKSTIKFIKGEVVDSAETCPICGQWRVCLPEEGMPTAFHGSPNICKH